MSAPCRVVFDSPEYMPFLCFDSRTKGEAPNSLYFNTIWLFFPSLVSLCSSYHVRLSDLASSAVRPFSREKCSRKLAIICYLLSSPGRQDGRDQLLRI